MTDHERAPGLLGWFRAKWANASVGAKAALALGGLLFVLSGLILLWTAWGLWQGRDGKPVKTGGAVVLALSGALWFGAVAFGLGSDGGSPDSVPAAIASIPESTTTSASVDTTTTQLVTTTIAATTSSTTQATTTTSLPATTTSKATTTTSPAATTSAPAVTTTSQAAGNCHPSYPDFCIPPPPPDLNCPDISQKNFTVLHNVPNPDPHGFDGNKDGVGCES